MPKRHVCRTWAAVKARATRCAAHGRRMSGGSTRTLPTTAVSFPPSSCMHELLGRRHAILLPHATDNTIRRCNRADYTSCFSENAAPNTTIPVRTLRISRYVAYIGTQETKRCVKIFSSKKQSSTAHSQAGAQVLIAELEPIEIARRSGQRRDGWDGPPRRMKRARELDHDDNTKPRGGSIRWEREIASRLLTEDEPFHALWLGRRPPPASSYLKPSTHSMSATGQRGIPGPPPAAGVIYDGDFLDLQ
jgi:hypothetical protein